MGSLRFKQVPEPWKYPLGPYRQAPPEHGGEWWLVNPFTTAEPWLTQGIAPSPEVLPPGFVEIFGPRPKISDFSKSATPSLLFRLATVQWEQDLRYFKQAGVPEWATAEQLASAAQVAQQWELGAPRFYEGRYGWMVRFPESQVKDFESSAWGILNAMHLQVAAYQLRLIDRGGIPRNRHPFVPPHVWPDGGVVNEGA